MHLRQHLRAQAWAARAENENARRAVTQMRGQFLHGRHIIGFVANCAMRQGRCLIALMRLAQNREGRVKMGLRGGIKGAR